MSLHKRLFVAVFAVVACGEPTVPEPSAVIHLTEEQAATVRSRFAQLNALGYFGGLETLNKVIVAGTEMDSVGVVTDLGPGPYYAFGLSTANQNGFTAFSYFNAILINNPSNPTTFILVTGLREVRGTTPSSSGSAVGSSLIHKDGSTVTKWNGTGAQGTFALGAPGSQCLVEFDYRYTCTTPRLTFSFIVYGVSANGELAARFAKVIGAEVPGFLVTTGLP
jgi:hypothetical protein